MGARTVRKGVGDAAPEGCREPRRWRCRGFGRRVPWHRRSPRRPRRGSERRERWHRSSLLRGLIPAALTLTVMLLTVGAFAAHAHPEYQRDLVSRSGRAVNCAYCHTSADGPEGTGIGQIGRLSSSELEQLGRARAALLPGSGATNPILNAFGNHLLEVVGKSKVLELRVAPAEIAGLLPSTSDLDGDGISDVQEYRDGTHPFLDSDGDPGRLFVHNLRRSAWQLLLTFGATALGLWGLKHLLWGFEAAARPLGHPDGREDRGA